MPPAALSPGAPAEAAEPERPRRREARASPRVAKRCAGQRRDSTGPLGGAELAVAEHCRDLALDHSQYVAGGRDPHLARYERVPRFGSTPAARLRRACSRFAARWRSGFLYGIGPSDYARISWPRCAKHHFVLPLRVEMARALLTFTLAA